MKEETEYTKWYSTAPTTNNNNNPNSSAQHHHQALVRAAMDHVPSTPNSMVVTRDIHKTKTKSFYQSVSKSAEEEEKEASSFACFNEGMHEC
jgi:hypothetical protein